MSVIITMRKKQISQNPGSQTGCRIDETFLSELGFYRVITERPDDTKTYRYCNNNGTGFDVIFSEEFNILTVEEFGYDETGRIRCNNTIVGMFYIQLPEDIGFIFSRNVRLNYFFKTSNKLAS